jgi:hypothetical protein
MFVFVNRFAREESVRKSFDETLTAEEQQVLIDFARVGIPASERRRHAIDEEKKRIRVCSRLNDMSDLEVAAALDQLTQESTEAFAREYAVLLDSLSKKAQSALKRYINSSVKPATVSSSWTALALKDAEVFREEVTSDCAILLNGPPNLPRPSPGNEIATTQDSSASPGAPGRIGSVKPSSQN